MTTLSLSWNMLSSYFSSLIIDFRVFFFRYCHIKIFFVHLVVTKISSDSLGKIWLIYWFQLYPRVKGNSLQLPSGKYGNEVLLQLFLSLMMPVTFFIWSDTPLSLVFRMNLKINYALNTSFNYVSLFALTDITQK